MTERYMLYTAVTSLSNALNNSATTFDVASVSNFPATGNFRIRVEEELMLVTGVSGSTLTVQRGIEGSSAVTHNAATPVYGVLTRSAFLIGIVRQPFTLPVRLDYQSNTECRMNLVGCPEVINPFTGDSTLLATYKSLSNFGLSANTLYYVYYSPVADTLTALETVPTTTEGIDHLTGDQTKLLIGWVQVNAFGLFQQTDASQLVASRYNQKTRRIVSEQYALTVAADDAWHPIYSNGIDPDLMLQFIDAEPLRLPEFSFNATANHSTGGAHVMAGIGFDYDSAGIVKPDPAEDCYQAYYVDSSTEKKGFSRVVYPIRPTALTTGMQAIAASAAVFVLGEQVGSGSYVIVTDSNGGTIVFTPLISARISY